jgi:hypothetical protein
MRIAWVAVCLAAACAKKEAPAPVTPATPGAPAPAPAAAAPGADVDVAAFCRATMQGANQAQCYGRDPQSESIKYGLCLDTLQSGLRAGKIEIRPDALAECRAQVEAALPRLDNQRSLAHLAEWFEPCRRAVVGTQRDGGDCLGTMECAPGLVCRQMVCRPPDQEGQKCYPVIEITMAVRESTCADGLWCDLKDATCRTQAAAGEACRTSDACAGDLRCRGGTCVEYAPSKAGGECDDAADCPAGHYCKLLEDRCVPLKPDGERCLSDSECLHQCADDGDDSVQDTCAPC